MCFIIENIGELVAENSCSFFKCYTLVLCDIANSFFGIPCKLYAHTMILYQFYWLLKQAIITYGRNHASLTAVSLLKLRKNASN